MPFMERAASAHFIFAFNPSPITILAIHKSQEITYSIQAPTALSLPCLSTHMFRKVSQTVPIFCFYRTRGTHRQIPVHNAGGRGVGSCVNQIFSGTCNAC